MTSYIALLRAVNVGRRQLRMDDLRRIGSELGLESPRTFIASGNLLFISSKDEAALRTLLEKSISGHLGKPVLVMVRTAQQMTAVAAANPFADQPGHRVAAIFLNDPPPADAIEKARNVADARLALGEREIYVHYPSGMGALKMQIPAAASGTARNMNTVAKLAELAKEGA